MDPIAPPLKLRDGNTLDLVAGDDFAYLDRKPVRGGWRNVAQLTAPELRTMAANMLAYAAFLESLERVG